MSDVLDRISDVLLSHDTSPAQEWVQERIDRELVEYALNGPWSIISNYVRPMVEVLSEDWQDGYEGFGSDAYEYRAELDADPLATWVDVDTHGREAWTPGEVRWLPTGASDWINLTSSIQAAASAFTEQMRVVNDTFARISLGNWTDHPIFVSCFLPPARPSVDPEVARVAYTTDLRAADDKGRAFTWPPRPVPDLWLIDLSAPDLPVDHPRTGPPRKATA